MRQQWTPFELAKLKRLRIAGLGHWPIARILNRPVGSVSAKIAALQLTTDQKTPYGPFGDRRRRDKKTNHTLPSME